MTNKLNNFYFAILEQLF